MITTDQHEKHLEPEVKWLCAAMMPLPLPAGTRSVKDGFCGVFGGVQNQHLSLLPDSLWPVQTGLLQAQGTVCVYFALWAVHTFLWARLPVLSPLTALPFRRCGFRPTARISSPHTFLAVLMPHCSASCLPYTLVPD